jgi:urease accessory protein
MTESFLLLQIADSAFPAGGFAHSAGLEAAVQLGGLRSAEELRRFAHESLWQAGHGALPFVAAAHREPACFCELDALCDAFLTNHVANRASRSQGRAWLGACAQVFEDARIRRLHEDARARVTPSHFVCAFGATTAALGLERRAALEAFAHLTVRTFASAAVRLGVVGPHEAQRLHVELASTMRAIVEHGEIAQPEEAAHSAPLLEVWSAQHDRLYAKLFLS